MLAEQLTQYAWYASIAAFPTVAVVNCRSGDCKHVLQVSRTAKMMVSQMGFSKLGQVAWQSGGGPSFVGASAGQAPDCSAHTQDMIDEESKELVERAYRCDSHSLLVL